MNSQDSTTARSVTDNLRHRTMAENTKGSLFAGGGALGALAMSSCCIVPLALFSLGVTGAWIGALTALYPYKGYFFVATAGFLIAGFWRVYRKPAAVECAEGSACAAPISDRANKIVLWSATALMLAALVFPYAASLFYEI